MKFITISCFLGLLILVMVRKAECHKKHNGGNYKPKRVEEEAVQSDLFDTGSGAAPMSPLSVNPKLLCKGNAADIIFVLDSSSSIYGEHFQKQLEFVKYMVEHLEIGDGPKQVQIGVVTFSDNATIRIHLHRFSDKSNLIWQIERIPQILGNTSIGDGLRVMRDQMFIPSKGARHDVRHIAIILTDGTSQDKHMTHKEAKASKHANIELFVIGIGDYISYPELKGIASDPKDKYLFTTPSYETLDRIRDDVIKEACTVIPQNISCKGSPADIVFILDSSSSIWREYFQKQLDFVKYMIDHFDVGGGPKQVRIGVETFSDLASVYVQLNNEFDKFVLKWKVDQIPQILGNTSIGDALREMRNNMFIPSKGARHGVRRVAIIITDGASQDKAMTQREARACRAAHIEIFVIGIGNYINYSELKGIASMPKDRFLFLTSTYKALDTIRDDVIKHTCDRDCNPGSETELVFLINNNHFGHEKTKKVLKAAVEVIKRFRVYDNIRFGMLFDQDHENKDLAVGSMPEQAKLERILDNYKFGPLVSLITKLRRKEFYGRSLFARRIGFLFLDKTVDLNSPELLVELKHLSFDLIDIYAAVIGDVDQQLVENTLVPRHHIIKVASFDHLISELPPRFTEKVCKPFSQ